MTKGSNFWVIGGEFGSMNFHKLVEGSAQVKGPFKTRKEAEEFAESCGWTVTSDGRVFCEDDVPPGAVPAVVAEIPGQLILDPRAIQAAFAGHLRRDPVLRRSRGGRRLRGGRGTGAR